MNFTDDDIERFRQAWKADFDELLTPEGARAQLIRLMHFFGTMAREFHRTPVDDVPTPLGCDTMAP